MRRLVQYIYGYIVRAEKCGPPPSMKGTFPLATSKRGLEGNRQTKDSKNAESYVLFSSAKAKIKQRSFYFIQKLIEATM